MRPGQNGLVIRPFRRPLLALAVLPLVVIVGFQSAWAAFACRFDGEVRDRCCCPSKQDRDEVRDDAPRVEARCCCDITFHASIDAPDAREAGRADFAHLELVLPTTTFVIVAPRPERMAAIQTLARPPPPPRIALYLDKHALLR